jgi:hypothetical protein
VALHLSEGAPGDPGERAQGFDDAGPELFRARYGLLPERPGDTHIELGWTDGRVTVDRDTEIAIEILCEHAATALDRIERADSAENERLAKVVNLRS